MKLRPYQELFISNIRQELGAKKRIIACAATGSGKSKVFISITRDAVAKGRRVLIISESIKIYKQISEEIGGCQNIGNGIKEERINMDARIFVAMAQTLAKRELLVRWFASLGQELLVITDESHVGTPAKLLKQIPDAYHIGFTATPDFRFAKHLPELYNGIVIGPQPQELVDAGYLSPYYHYARKVVNLTGLKKGHGGDFTEKSQEMAFEKKEVFEGLLDDLLKFTFKKCMIFCASIKHAHFVTEELRRFGYGVSEVHSKNDRSDYELFQFTSGPNKICVSVGALTKGFDYPEIDLIVLNRATISLPLYLQMCGRGSRKAEGKDRFTVIDMGGNGQRLGLWNVDREWDEMWSKRLKEKGVAPVKSCPKCDFLCRTSATHCPNCNHEFIKVVSIKPKKETELVELTAGYNLLRGKKISDLTPKELSCYAKFTGKKHFAIRIARSKGGAFLGEYTKTMGYKAGFIYHNQPDSTIEFNNITIL